MKQFFLFGLLYRLKLTNLKSSSLKPVLIETYSLLFSVSASIPKCREPCEFPNHRLRSLKPASAPPIRGLPVSSGGSAMEEQQQQQPLLEVEQCVTSIPEDHEATCWGCGLRLIFASYAPVFKCGWCGAITQSNQTSRKPDSVCFSHWRNFRDRFFVTVLILFMLFVICVLAVFTITSYCLASFKSAGAPADMRWGSYPMVGKNDLENYTFCTYCSKPKPPRAHHCRSCKILGTVWELQITVLFYAAGMTIYSSYRIWPPLDFENLASTRRSMGYIKMLIEIIGTLASSAFFLSARGLVTVYIAFASLSVNAGIGVLLFQQLSYIYEGNTYLNRLSSLSVMHGERGLQNLIRFFGCPYSSIIGLLKHWQVTGQFEFKTSLEI
uniref:Protein S-acyltransferase n=1 Tax=Oryza barthii TaxID=65489 RepID=A0A0D3G1M5_9ORYZ